MPMELEHEEANNGCDENARRLHLYLKGISYLIIFYTNILTCLREYNGLFVIRMPYVPPNMRAKGIIPKKLETPKLKTEQPINSKEELFESLKKDRYGKADEAWLEPDPKKS